MNFRDTLRARWHLAALLVASTALPAVAHGVLLSVTPAGVAADYTATITLNITGLASGETVKVDTFIDSNASGALDAADMLVQSFQVSDGQAPSTDGVRNTNVPGDEDGAADTKIRTVLNFQIQAEANKAVAKYFYRVSPVSGSFTPVTTPFTITQPLYSQKVVGKVTSGGAAVPFAFVFLAKPNSNPSVLALADAGGNFMLNAAPGAYRVGVVKTGFLFDFNTAPQVTLAAGQTVTQNLSVSAANRTISGQLTDTDSDAGIPAIQMSAQAGDSGLFSLAFTDTNGNFSIPVSSAATQWDLDVSYGAAAFSGYLPLNDRYPVDTGGGSVSEVQIQLPKATALIYGTLKYQTQPLAGVSIYAGRDQYTGYGLTDSSGNYVAGVTDGNWYVQPDSDDLAARGYFASGTQVTVSEGQALRQDISAHAFTAHLIGRVTDDGGHAVTDICITAYPQQGGSGNDVQTDDNGNFNVPVAGGTWVLQLCDEDAQQRGLVRATLTYNVTDGVDIPGIQYVAKQATAQITGWVKDNTNGAVRGVGVSTNITWNGINYSMYQRTNADGTYSLAAFNGTWQVSVDCYNLQSSGYNCVGSQTVTVPGNTTAYFTVYPQGALQVTTTSLPDGTQGQYYPGVQLNASGGAGSYNWDLAPGSQPLPPGLTLSSSGYLSGTPTNGGQFAFTVRVTDGANHTATQGLSLFINTQPLQINTYFPSGQVGVPYNVALQASGGQPPYTWSLMPGSQPLPPGLMLSGSTVSGTPTTAGNFSFYMQVMDGANNTANGNFSIYINPAPLQWVTASLPDGAVGSAYSKQLEATGGVPPYHWTVAPGSLPLPPGLMLEPGGSTPTPGSIPGGTIYGTPTTDGTFDFILRVGDSYTQSTDRHFSLRILKSPTVTPTRPTATPTPTPTPQPPGPCIGDCGGNLRVTIDEILTMVNIALGNLRIGACEAGDANHDERITIDEILTAVNNALTECPEPSFCGGIGGLPCRTGEICDLRDPSCAVLDLLGTCVQRPEICPDIYDPVCGCDGVTYANECTRLNIGATLAHAGACP